jgi:purine-binding chemotaxis protein CheW
MTESPKKYCTFIVEDHYFGIDVNRVQELIPPQVIRPIPQSPPVVRGLINLRGRIVTAIDLRVALGFRTRANIDESVNVIVYAEGEKISLLVDQIGEVVEFSDGQCESPPETVARSFNRMLDAIFTLEDRLLLILNVDKVIAADGINTNGSADSPRNVEQLCF